MTILFLTHYFFPEGNAPATRTYEHCKRWIKMGCKVIVITCAPNVPNGIVYDGYKNKIFQKEIIDGIEVIRLWTYLAPNKGFLKRILNYLSYMIVSVFYVILFQKNFNVIIATSPQFFCGWAGVLCHWLKLKPFILEIRDIWPESITTIGAMQKSILIRFLEFLERTMYKSATHIIAVGEGYKRKIVEKGIPPDKISVVPNGVSLANFQRVPDVSEIKAKYGATGKFVCSYIGTVGMAHGLDVIIRAALKLKSQNDNSIIFWIVGDGALREDLQKIANEKQLDNIVFTGRLDKNLIPQIISATDVTLVHLRKTELFEEVIPSKIFEFMAMDCPIIIGVKGEAQKIVLEANAGLEMEPEKEDDLINKIRIVQSGKLKFKAREYVEKNFNRDNLAKIMLQIITNHL